MISSNSYKRVNERLGARRELTYINFRNFRGEYVLEDQLGDAIALVG